MKLEASEKTESRPKAAGREHPGVKADAEFNSPCNTAAMSIRGFKAWAPNPSASGSVLLSTQHFTRSCNSDPCVQQLQSMNPSPHIRSFCPHGGATTKFVPAFDPELWPFTLGMHVSLQCVGSAESPKAQRPKPRPMLNKQTVFVMDILSISCKLTTQIPPNCNTHGI